MQGHALTIYSDIPTGLCSVIVYATTSGLAKVTTCGAVSRPGSQTVSAPASNKELKTMKEHMMRKLMRESSIVWSCYFDASKIDAFMNSLNFDDAAFMIRSWRELDISTGILKNSIYDGVINEPKI